MSLISQTEVNTQPGTYTYIVPPGISTVEFHLWGAGGAIGESGPLKDVQTGTTPRTVSAGFVRVQSGTQQVQTGTQQVQTGTSPIVTGSEPVQIGTREVQIGTQLVSPERQVQTGTITVQTGTRQVQTGTTQVQVGTRQESYVVSVLQTNSKGQVVNNNGKGQQFQNETRFRTVPVFETRPVFRTDPVFETRPTFTTIPAVVRPIIETQPITVLRPTVVTVPVFDTQPIIETQPTFGLQETFRTVQDPVFEARAGGLGAAGANGGYSSRKIQVSQGDIIVVYVGGAGVRNVGGTSLTTPVNYSGGNAGSASNGGRGGGGGGATVLTLNGTVIAVAAGGGGGGGGGVLGAAGDPGSPAVISGIGSGDRGQGRSSSSGPATGGGGGGGYYSGSAGSSGTKGGQGFGGVSFGTVIQSGAGLTAGGAARNLLGRAASTAGFASSPGAVALVFTKSFNINVKQTNDWKSVDRAWVKVNDDWKDILKGWVKVSGVWEPLITERLIEGAENLANPTITYALSANRSNIAEGSAVSFTISTTGLLSGNLVPYTATGIAPADLQVGSMSGSFTVGTGETITFVPRENNTTNGVRNLRVILNNTEVSAVCEILDTSLTPVYTIVSNVSVMNEGQAVIFALGKVNGVAGQNINYNITGIEASRISSGSLTGTFVVGSNEQATIAVREDNTTTGDTQMVMQLVNRPASTTVTVRDTSLTPIPVYTISANVSVIDEGQAVRFTLGKTNGVAGQNINYNITSIAASRISSGSLTGTFVVGSNEQATIAVREDNTTTGDTQMVMRLAGISNTASVTVRDTSLTPPPPSGSITFTTSGNWTVPTGVNSISVSVIGAGGGGGGGHGCKNVAHTGGDGGAGEAKSFTRGVTPGASISFEVGNRGSGGAKDNSGTAGGGTSILGVTARGGGGGIFGTSKGRGASGTSYGGGAGGGAGGAVSSTGSAGSSGSITISWG
jgi:hypothetical protein